MNVNFNLKLPGNISPFLKNFLPQLSCLQKKIVEVVAVVFGILAVFFGIQRSFFNFNLHAIKDLIIKKDTSKLLSYLSKYGKKVKELDLSSQDINDVSTKNQCIKEIVALCPNLQKLILCKLGSDHFLEHLTNLSSLKTLELPSSQLDDDDLKILETMKSVENLAFSYSNITDADLVYFRNLVQLKSLNLSGCKIVGSGLEHLKILNNLRCLNLNSCDQLIDASLSHVSQNLQFLDLVRCSKITDTGLLFLKGARSQMRNLHLRFHVGASNVNYPALVDLISYNCHIELQNG